MTADTTTLARITDLMKGPHEGRSAAIRALAIEYRLSPGQLSVAMMQAAYVEELAYPTVLSPETWALLGFPPTPDPWPVQPHGE